MFGSLCEQALPLSLDKVRTFQRIIINTRIQGFNCRICTLFESCPSNAYQSGWKKEFAKYDECFAKTVLTIKAGRVSFHCVASFNICCEFARETLRKPR